MYNIDHEQDNYCLDHFPEFRHTKMQQIIPYCFRSDTQSTRIYDANFDNTYDPHFTFNTLYEQNITSQELLQWSATIDLAERYQIYIENKKSFVPFKDDQYVFYKCSWPWFGPVCQFSFDYFRSKYFHALVQDTFESKIPNINNTMITCYLHLKCDTLLICLDWRDICDGKMDCLDGTDESDCWLLEMNECISNEFRCHNGQCIPKSFLLDNSFYPDCLDRSDESLYVEGLFSCIQDPSFRCEDRTCRPGTHEFACGDGQCMTEMGTMCYNGKGSILPNGSCFNALDCLVKIVDDRCDQWCEEICSDINYISDNCSALLEFPPDSVLFGHVRLVYEIKKMINKTFLPSYVCYNEKLCEDFLPATIYLNGSACRYIDQFDISTMNSEIDFEGFIQHLKRIFRACAIVSTGTYDCNHANAYQCKNSTKCISKYRLVDGFKDCPYQDDEDYSESCELSDSDDRFRCFNDQKRCFAHIIVGNIYYDCPTGEDESEIGKFMGKYHIYFQTICNGYEELIPIMIDGRNETDETECEYWPCDSIYNRCDGIWTCKNGIDEINCKDSICPSFHHMCVFPNEPNKLQCIRLNQTGNDNIDCLGASDERQHCRMLHENDKHLRFYCWNDTKCIDVLDICDGIEDCRFGDDEQFCINDEISSEFSISAESSWKIEKFFHNLHDFSRKKLIYFTLENMLIYPSNLNNDVTKSLSEDSLLKSTPNSDIENDWMLQCNRGLNIRIRMNSSENKSERCLCPPSYYGETCQYQNERVSIIIQLYVASDWRTLFTVLFLLLDNEGKVHSHDWIEYLPIRDYNTKNYSVRIDIFNKLTLNYRASWIFPILFSFLPVYPLATQLIIPISSVQPITYCPLPCIHGQCIKYTNTENTFFCRCDHGWSGSQCSIAHQCNCSSGSLCIDQSICICSVHKFGSLCYLNQILCKENKCLNNGRCVMDDSRGETIQNMISMSTCICPEGYNGNSCQFNQTRLDISFADNFNIPESIFIHFIETFTESPHIQTTISKLIPFHQTKITIHTSIIFNIAFAQFQDKYHLIVLRKSYIDAEDISTQITLSNQCLSIQQLFNTTIANQHLLRRIKHYHVPCQQRKELICFYDAVHLCLCDLSRHANCFKFNIDVTNNCYGLSPCENGGQCFQDDQKCPTSFICVCPTCFYGPRCQFSTKGFRLSLDAILGYQIRPNIVLSQQSTAVKVSIVLTTTIFILGQINAFLLAMTFCKKQTRKIGCDIYLLALSIVTTFTMNAFLLKTCFMLITQMSLIRNRLFILGQCRSMEFIIRICLSVSDWLHACIAIERVIISNGAVFNKRKSKKIAKWMIIIIFLIVTCTNIQEPLHRRLMDDEDEERTWCVITLSPSIQMFDSIINLLHFLLPFSINLISTLIIIVVTARTRSNIQRKQIYIEHFYQQLQNHKHLLISPCILILLASPRLLIPFLSEFSHTFYLSKNRLLFDYTNFTHALIHSASFKAINFTKSDWSNVQASQIGIYNSIFTNTIMDKSSLIKSTIQDSVFKYMNFYETDLSYAKFYNVTFINSNMYSVNMSFISCEYCFFINGNFEDIIWTHISLEYSKFLDCSIDINQLFENSIDVLESELINGANEYNLGKTDYFHRVL
ncbi:unnamed protein product [Adineta ricciae]|uniref:Uncharacterized protein n=1 Tax=Adineta ricciae TaxID=249248 RepID=A0A814WAV7_ADIRI|nr:unnamed protein product [Adineta ricciae]CAF1611419.1 unnamed protein product [Adineta ricciae]